jgi:hypothetical protein
VFVICISTIEHRARLVTIVVDVVVMWGTHVLCPLILVTLTTPTGNTFDTISAVVTIVSNNLHIIHVDGLFASFAHVEIIRTVETQVIKVSMAKEIPEP